MSKQWFLGVAIVSFLAITSCVSSPPEGTIIIMSQVDLSSRSIHGTFEVTEGAEVLGCTSGSFVATTSGSSDLKKHTCESGERSGTFTVEFNAPNTWVDEWDGPWTVKWGTDDFSGLSGGGEIRAILDQATESAVETITGEIQFNE